MAFLGLKLPHETARILSEIEVPGKTEAPSHFHITLLHLGDEVPIETLGKALVATYEVSSQTNPFTVRTSRVSSFPATPDGETPVICLVDSDDLHELHRRLSAAYDKAGVDFSKKFPTYRPHVTLAYSKDASVRDRRIPTVEWGAHELVLWGGDSGDRRVVMSFPFSIKTSSLVSKIAWRHLGKRLGLEPPP